MVKEIDTKRSKYNFKLLRDVVKTHVRIIFFCRFYEILMLSMYYEVQGTCIIFHKTFQAKVEKGHIYF